VKRQHNKTKVAEKGETVASRERKNGPVKKKGNEQKNASRPRESEMSKRTSKKKGDERCTRKGGKGNRLEESGQKKAKKTCTGNSQGRQGKRPTVGGTTALRERREVLEKPVFHSSNQAAEVSKKLREKGPLKPQQPTSTKSGPEPA